MVEAPAFKELASEKAGSRSSNGESINGDKKKKRVLAKR
jgi:hypothetical protein